MHKKVHPVRNTMLFGVAAALLFMPAVTLLGKIMAWPVAFRLAVWAIVLGYSYLLAAWSGNGPARIIIFPGFILLVAALWSNATMYFLVLALLILAWIRQSCFMKFSAKAFLVEALVCGGAMAPILFFTPHSTPSLAISVWLFFLVQALYFIFWGSVAPAGTPPSQDRFAKACRQAEEILSS